MEIKAKLLNWVLAYEVIKNKVNFYFFLILRMECWEVAETN